MYFASPLTKNPGYLFGEFDLQAEGEFFTESHSPVAQTLVRLESVEGKGRLADVSVHTPVGVLQVGQVELPFSFRGNRERIARVAIHVRNAGESAIVFANGPSDATEIAERLAAQIKEKTSDKDILELVDFVRTHVHPRFALADTLMKGVAFHYGRMPHIIRAQVEMLCRTRKLQYVVCTSTLLQGVNLPARHIIVLQPRQGNKDPMATSDFWNLVGARGGSKRTSVASCGA